MHNVKFPGLGLEMTINEVAFTIGTYPLLVCADYCNRIYTCCTLR